MSLQQIVFFDAEADDNVASLQNGVAGVSLVINPTTYQGVPLGDSYIRPTNTYFEPGNFQRLITLTSLNDLSAVNFEINGADINGIPISETVVGPNAATVSSTAEFHQVFSIIPDDVAAGVSAGVGDEGSSSWITLDRNRTNPALAVIQAEAVGTINYTVYGTASRPIEFTTNKDSGGTMVINSPYENPVSVAFTGATGDVVGNCVLNYQALKVVVNSSNGGALRVTVLQSGI